MPILFPISILGLGVGLGFLLLGVDHFFNLGIDSENFIVTELAQNNELETVVASLNREFFINSDFKYWLAVYDESFSEGLDDVLNLSIAYQNCHDVCMSDKGVSDLADSGFLEDIADLEEHWILLLEPFDPFLYLIENGFLSSDEVNAMSLSQKFLIYTNAMESIGLNLDYVYFNSLYNSFFNVRSLGLVALDVELYSKLLKCIAGKEDVMGSLVISEDVSELALGSRKAADFLYQFFKLVPMELIYDESLMAEIENTAYEGGLLKAVELYKKGLCMYGEGGNFSNMSLFDFDLKFFFTLLNVLRYGGLETFRKEDELMSEYALELVTEDISRLELQKFIDTEVKNLVLNSMNKLGCLDADKFLKIFNIYVKANMELDYMNDGVFDDPYMVDEVKEDWAWSNLYVVNPTFYMQRFVHDYVETIYGSCEVKVPFYRERVFSSFYYGFYLLFQRMELFKLHGTAFDVFLFDELIVSNMFYKLLAQTIVIAPGDMEYWVKLKQNFYGVLIEDDLKKWGFYDHFLNDLDIFGYMSINQHAKDRFIDAPRDINWGVLLGYVKKEMVEEIFNYHILSDKTYGYLLEDDKFKTLMFTQWTKSGTISDINRDVIFSEEMAFRIKSKLRIFFKNEVDLNMNLLEDLVKRVQFIYWEIYRTDCYVNASMRDWLDYRNLYLESLEAPFVTEGMVMRNLFAEEGSDLLEWGRTISPLAAEAATPDEDYWNLRSLFREETYDTSIGIDWPTLLDMERAVYAESAGNKVYYFDEMGELIFTLVNKREDTLGLAGWTEEEFQELHKEIYAGNKLTEADMQSLINVIREPAVSYIKWGPPAVYESTRFSMVELFKPATRVDSVVDSRIFKLGVDFFTQDVYYRHPYEK